MVPLLGKLICSMTSKSWSRTSLSTLCIPTECVIPSCSAPEMWSCGAFLKKMLPDGSSLRWRPIRFDFRPPSPRLKLEPCSHWMTPFAQIIFRQNAQNENFREIKIFEISNYSWMKICAIRFESKGSPRLVQLRVLSSCAYVKRQG